MSALCCINLVYVYKYRYISIMHLSFFLSYRDGAKIGIKNNPNIRKYAEYNILSDMKGLLYCKI